MDPDYLDLLRCLNGHRVRYLVIGGYAVILYTEPRYTNDLDIWVEASAANARRVLKALDEFGAPLDNLTVKDLAKPGLVYVFGLPPLRVDVLNRVAGSSFAAAWRERKRIDVGGVKANFVGKRCLMAQKRAAGRFQDLADLEKLKRLGI